MTYSRWNQCLDREKHFGIFFLFKIYPYFRRVKNLMNYIILQVESFEYAYIGVWGEREVKYMPRKKSRWEKMEWRNGEEKTTRSPTFICRWQVNDSTSTKNIVGLFITGGGPNSSYDTLFINGFAVSVAAGLRLWIMSTASREWW